MRGKKREGTYPLYRQPSSLTLPDTSSAQRPAGREGRKGESARGTEGKRPLRPPNDPDGECGGGLHVQQCLSVSEVVINQYVSEEMLGIIEQRLYVV